MPSKPNILTVDLEEWFHIDERFIPPGEWDRLPSRVEANVRALLEFLDECGGVRATFFAVGWVAARHQGLIQDIHDRGHELAVHGYLHQAIAPMSPEEFRADLRAARREVEGCTGQTVLGHRAPRWSLGGAPGKGRRGRASGAVLSAIDVLIQEGIRYDSSLAPIVYIGDPAWPKDPYRIERDCGSILELPPMIGRRFGVRLLFAGGWALRRVPNRVLMREIARRNDRGAPAVIDLHTWEMDPDPPRVRLPLLYRMAHYGGLGGYTKKLRELLTGLPWGPARDYLDSAPQPEAPFDSPKREASRARSAPSTRPSASMSARPE